MQEKKTPSGLRDRILNIIGITLCVLLIPILIVNCVLLVKGWTNQDEVPSFGSISPLIVLTDSMENEFPAGSLIFIKKAVAEEIEKGDIISFFDPSSKSGAVVTHMVMEIHTDPETGALSFTTMGTANNVEDRDPVPADKLVGRYTGVHFKGLGNVAMFMQTTAGFIVCVFIPLFALVGYDILRRRAYDKKHENDKDELMRELEELRRLRSQTEVGVRNEEVGVEETNTDGEK